MGTWQTRVAEWLVGALIGGMLALLVSALANSMMEKTPPPVGQKQPPPTAPVLPMEPKFGTPAPALSPVPNRNEIRLPLPTPGPIQTQATPPQPKPTPAKDPWACDAAGVTLLMQAAAAGDLSQMQDLVARGADIGQLDAQAHAALYYAIGSHCVPAIQWLLARGADPDLPGRDGFTPLDDALATWDLTVIEPVLWARAPRIWTTSTREALFTAIRTRNKPMICTLLAAHPEPPTLEDSRQPLLAYMLVWGTEDQFLMLLECGADPNTLLGSPVEKAFSQWVKSRNFRNYLESEPGITVLMVAAAQGRLECTEALIACGARRNAHTGHYKMTAIDFASRYDASPEMLQVLLGKSPRPEDQHMWVNISLERQRAVLYKDGEIVLVTEISTGMPGYPTPTGRFVVTDKDKLRESSIYHGAYMPYFMRMSCRDFGMHAGVVPGHPASHGCIRLPYSSAVRLFREVEIGTLVTISQ